MKMKFAIFIFAFCIGLQVHGQDKEDDLLTPVEAAIFPGCEDIIKKIEKKSSEKNKLKLMNCQNMEMIKFIYSNIRYPIESKSKNIEGDVFLRFVISDKGEVSDVEIKKGVSPELDQEAIRVIRLMPDFIPAKNKLGNAVEMVMNIPVKFKL